MKTEKEIIEAQDDVLMQAWKEGALNNDWYDKWIEEVYSQVRKDFYCPKINKCSRQCGVCENAERAWNDLQNKRLK